MSAKSNAVSPRFPVAMTIAGSDSGGGAGIQADLRAFRCCGVYGCSAIAAVTAQNPAEVRRIDPLPPESLDSQIRAVLDAFHVRAIKTGMLFSRDLIRAAVGIIKKHHDVALVVDPVMVSTSGSRLLREDAIQEVIDSLLPEADWITPNIPEAELLLNRKLNSFNEIRNAAKELSARFRCGTILKGGHSDADPAARDVVCTADGIEYLLTSPRIPVLPHASHGTGCSFSAALAACIARNMPVDQALLTAKTLIYLSLENAGYISRNDVSPIAGMPPVLADFPCISSSVSLEKLT